jgi:hypothetical protein
LKGSYAHHYALFLLCMTTDQVVFGRYISQCHIRTYIASKAIFPLRCNGRESNMYQLLGRRLCLPLCHHRLTTDQVVFGRYISQRHIRTYIASKAIFPLRCNGRESNMDQLLGRRLCSPLCHHHLTTDQVVIGTFH